MRRPWDAVPLGLLCTSSFVSVPLLRGRDSVPKHNPHRPVTEPVIRYQRNRERAIGSVASIAHVPSQLSRREPRTSVADGR